MPIFITPPSTSKDLPLEYAFAFQQVDLGMEAEEVPLAAKSVTAYKSMRMSPGGFALHGSRVKVLVWQCPR